MKARARSSRTRCRRTPLSSAWPDRVRSPVARAQASAARDTRTNPGLRYPRSLLPNCGVVAVTDHAQQGPADCGGGSLRRAAAGRLLGARPRTRSRFHPASGRQPITGIINLGYPVDPVGRPSDPADTFRQAIRLQRASTRSRPQSIWGAEAGVAGVLERARVREGLGTAQLRRPEWPGDDLVPGEA